MKKLFLVQAFDQKACCFFLPNPCLFETELEANAYCINYNIVNPTVLFGYRKVQVGKWPNKLSQAETIEKETGRKRKYSGPKRKSKKARKTEKDRLEN